MFLALVAIFQSSQPLLGERESDPGSDKPKRKVLISMSLGWLLGIRHHPISHVSMVSGTHPKTVIEWGGHQQLSRSLPT